MPISPHSSGPHPCQHSAAARAAWTAGACCFLFAVGTDGGRLCKNAVGLSSAFLAAPVVEVSAFAANSPHLDAMLSDVRFAAQGWRWSPGSTAWIAVLVRVDALKTVGLARIGGLYGP